MARLAYGLAIAGVLAAVGAARAEDAVKGVYLGSAEFCAQAKKDGLQTLIDNNTMILSARGLESVEFNCAFLQTLKNPRVPAGWVVTAMCEVPDYAYPEVFTLVERTAGELQLNALTEIREADQASAEAQEDETDAAEGEAEANPDAEPDAPQGEAGAAPDDEGEAATGLSGTYYRCEGLALP